MMAKTTGYTLCLALVLLGTQTSYGQYPSGRSGGSLFGSRSAGYPAYPAAYQAEEPPALPDDVTPLPGQAMPGPGPDAVHADGGGYPGGGALGCCDQCGDPACGGGCCPPAGNRLHFFGGVEYMRMWNFRHRVPTLVTTSPATTTRYINNNTNLPNAGVLGRAGIPVYGGDAGDLNAAEKDGGRLTFGMFLDPAANVAWVTRLSAINGSDQHFAQTSTAGNPTIVRPFFDVFSINPQGENGYIIGYRDENNVLIAEGDIEVDSSSEYLFAESYLKTMMHDDGCLRVDLISGYQFTSIRTDLTISSFDTTFPQGPVDTFLQDFFKARNEFHGGVVGFQLEKRRGRFTANALVKAGFGATRQVVRLTGVGVQTVGGNAANLGGGLLVQQTNAGPNADITHTRWMGSVVPELNLTLGMWLTPHLQATIGYTGIFWTDVVQAGDIVDRRVNLSQQAGQLIGTAAPTFNWNDNSYWVQGMTAGLNWDF